MILASNTRRVHHCKPFLVTFASAIVFDNDSFVSLARFNFHVTGILVSLPIATTDSTAGFRTRRCGACALSCAIDSDNAHSVWRTRQARARRCRIACNTPRISQVYLRECTSGRIWNYVKQRSGESSSPSRPEIKVHF